MRRKEVGVANDSGPLRLRRVCVEDGIDRIRVGGLQTRILLKLAPDAVLRIDGVIDLEDQQILTIAVVERLRADVRTSAAAEGIGGSLCAWKQSAIPVKRTRQNRGGRPRRVAVKGEHIAVKGDLGWLRGKRRSI